jgi:hypothetical protein
MKIVTMLLTFAVISLISLGAFALQKVDQYGGCPDGKIPIGDTCPPPESGASTSQSGGVSPIGTGADNQPMGSEGESGSEVEEMGQQKVAECIYAQCTFTSNICTTTVRLKSILP